MDLKPEQIQQMIVLLQTMLEGASKVDSDAIEESVPKKTKTSKTRRKTTEPKSKKGINKFDTMIEARMHKDDTRIDKLLCVNEPTPRVREFVPLTVICRVCGKKESVNPVVLTDSADRYKCNKCARSAG